MNKYALIIYCIGAIVTHYLIYKDEDPDEVEHASASAASVLWPLTWAIYILVRFEKCIERLFFNDHYKE